MILKCLNEEIECVVAVKGSDYIRLYADDAMTQEIASFGGVSDFTGFKLIGGEWTVPPATAEEQLRADVDYLLMLEGEI